VAELAGAADRTQTKQFDVRREVVFAHRLVVHERGAQVFLIVVAEDGDDGGVRRDFVLGAQAARKLQPEEIPTAKPRLKASFCAMRMASPAWARRSIARTWRCWRSCRRP